MTETTTATAEATTTGSVDATIVKPAPKKIRSICVDTFTAFQKNEILKKWGNGDTTKHDDWKDYGVEINIFIRELIKRGFAVVGILGTEGTGKSYGMKFLESQTNIWFNADNKNPTYLGGKDEYGTKIKRKWFNKLPETYEDVVKSIDGVIAKGMLHELPVAFLIAHTEEYKSSNDKIKQRLKTLGKLTNKLNIEDLFEMCYYTEVTKVGDKAKYQLRTQNNGADTCRTMEGQHATTLIDNNFQLIIDSIDKY